MNALIHFSRGKSGQVNAVVLERLAIVGILVYGITYGYDGPVVAVVGIANSALLAISSQQVKEPEYEFSTKPLTIEA